MDQNNSSSNSPQQDNTQPTGAQTQVQPNTVPQSNPTATPTPTPDINSQQIVNQTQTSSDITQQAEGYVEEVGGSLLDLMDEVSTDDTLIQTVADEMKLDINKVKSILTTLLDKIDKDQITIEELAFIMAVTVVDEPQGEK
jgi:hypothetical protein